MKIAILVENQYQVLEVWYPYYRLKEEGFESVFVGTGQGTYLGKEGYPVTEELSIQNANADEFCGVIIPGGFAPDHMRRHPEVAAFVKSLFTENKLVAAICHGGWILASAGVLKGKKATSFFAIKDDMVHAGAEYVDASVVVDGHLITSRKPEDLPDFSRAILSFLHRQ